MNATRAAHRLHQDIVALKTAQATETTKLDKVEARRQAIVDEFQAHPNMASGKEQALINKMFTLGEKSARIQDKFDAEISKDRKDGRALLKTAEPALTAKQLNKDRERLGLKALKTDPGSGGSKKGEQALAIARSHLGTNIADLKKHGDLAPYLDKNMPNNICCANFVSACLEKAGLIKHSERSDHTRYLARNLSNDKNWEKVDAQHLSPGDVVAFQVPKEGHYAHTEIFAGYDKHGKPTFVGSNNVNKDGSQRISFSHATYHIDAAFHYVG